MTPWPPQTVDDILAMDHDEVVDGYTSYEHDDPEPGPNRTPGFRWGWFNRCADMTHVQDEHYPLRRAMARWYLDGNRAGSHNRCPHRDPLAIASGGAYYPNPARGRVAARAPDLTPDAPSPFSPGEAKR